MPRIGREDEPPLPHRQQVVGAHQPRDALVVHHHALVVQLRGHPAVPVEAILQRDALNEIAQFDVGLARLVFRVVPVEAGAADARDVAGAIRLEALKLHHASDLSVDAVAPVSVFFRRDSFTRLKALRKKSISRACWPILRSNSATRRAAASSGLAGGPRRIRNARRPANRPLQSRRAFLAVRIAPAVQHAALDLELLVQGAHALAVEDPLRHALP